MLFQALTNVFFDLGITKPSYDGQFMFSEGDGNHTYLKLTLFPPPQKRKTDIYPDI